MFKHLLLTTDGSPRSDYAVEQGLALAQATQAKVTALHVMPAFHVLSLHMEALGDSQEAFVANTRRISDEILSKVAAAAERAGVPCETVADDHDHVDEAIVNIAKARNCDLIVMASHGRRGFRSVLLGSETHKVLTHAPTAVLVFRPPE